MCGNGTRDTACETLTNCPADCGVYNYNNQCESGQGETPSNRPDCDHVDVKADDSDESGRSFTEELSDDTDFTGN